MGFCLAWCLFGPTSQLGLGHLLQQMRLCCSELDFLREWIGPAQPPVSRRVCLLVRMSGSDGVQHKRLQQVP